MIYLIGGPPKCGKTTLAKKFSKEQKIPWIASDTLQVVGQQYVRKYVSKKEFKRLYPSSINKGKTTDETYLLRTPKQRAKDYQRQAKASYLAIEMFSLCEIKDQNDYIVEGFHVTPELAAQLIKKYGQKNFRVLFLYKKDVNKFVRDVRKSSTPNDWILRDTKKPETFQKIAEMVSYYGHFFIREASKYKFKTLCMDDDFGKQLNKAVKLLSR